MSYRVGENKRCSLKRKSRYEYARDLHLTFASIGGGLHLAILAYKIHEVFTPSPKNISFDSIMVIFMQLAGVAIVWTRMYWVYLNVMVFFRPFDNPKIFTIDIFAFLMGGVGIFFLGHTAPWFIFNGLCLVACCCRIIYTVNRAHEIVSLCCLLLQVCSSISTNHYTHYRKACYPGMEDYQ